MTTISCTVFLTFALVQISYQRSTPESDSYVAAVVEFSPEYPSPSGEAPTAVNALGYVAFIEEAAKQRWIQNIFRDVGKERIYETEARNVVTPTTATVTCDISHSGGLQKRREWNEACNMVDMIRLACLDESSGDLPAGTLAFDTKDADIIVFPEAGLTSTNLPGRDKLDAWTTFIPPPSSDFIPCIDSTIPVSESLRAISCSARENNLYVVINIGEKVVCANQTCPTDNRFFYNSNVVFDRNGKIIARYRKTNLFNEPGLNVTKIPEVVTFETDFGVTFGTFICFDILFKKPAMYLTRMRNITDVVFPTAWFSEVPFLTALQIQAGWAYAEDVNFLVSGYDRPQSGSTGSGIYLGRQGIAKATIPATARSELLIAKVPKKSARGRPAYSYSEEDARAPAEEEEHWVHIHDELRRRRSEDQPEPKAKQETAEKEGISLFYDNLSAYKSVQFNSSIAQTLCDGDFCCDFNIELTNVDPSSSYHLVAYDGRREFLEPVIVGVQVCAVVLCANESVASCAIFEKSETTFDVISINVTFPNYENLLIMPNSLSENFFPLSNWTYEERYEDKKVHIIAKLGAPAKNVVTCGIYTREFSRDQLAKESNSSSINQWATLTALALVSIFLIFLYRKGWRKPWHRKEPNNSERHGPYQHLRIR